MRRRTALNTLAAVAASTPASAATEAIAMRKFGRTTEKISSIGLGGYHLGMPKDSATAVRIIRTAVDGGITFLDNCWDYHDGESERRMGLALRDGYRQKAFLMTKFDGRTKASAAKQIDESMQRLQTDHIDLMQYHENIRMEDPDRFFAEGGPLEALLAAKQAGKIRYIGFTGHKDPAVHLRMLEVAAAHRFQFDSCQMPLNVLDAHFRSFAQQVLPKLVEQGIAVLGMKPLAGGDLPKLKAVTPVECLHYALNLPTSAVITGCDTVARVEQALGAARSFRPLSPTQVSALLEKTKSFAMSGKYESFKTTTKHDGTAKNIHWMA